jgi:hypothetical protein
MDRRTVARLDAAVIEWSGYEQKESYKLLIEELKEVGITVTFDQIEKSVHRLGLKWRDVFLPATRLERGHPDARANDAKPKADKWSVFEELDKTTDVHWSTADPDMRAVLDRIEQLEQTLATNGLAEYRGLLQQAQTEAQLAKDRAAAMRADIRAVLEQLDRISRRQDILYNIVGSVKLEHDRQKAAAARSLLQDAEHASPEETQQ